MADKPIDAVSIPDASALPKTGTLPAHQEPINNLAKDTALVAAMLSVAKSRKSEFNAQEPRKKFCDTGGTMDIADRMYRIALRRDTSSVQTQDTLSNVTSTSYRRAVRTISSGENMMFFDGENLPAVYKPEVNTKEYTAAQGIQIADQQNMLQEFTFDEDKRIDKIKELISRTNKYSNYMAWEEWDRVEREVTERVPTAFDEDGNPTAYDFVKNKRIVKDCPSLHYGDPKDFWFDSHIDDMNSQRWIIHRFQITYEDLVAQQAQGKITNVDKIKTSHLYAGESDEDTLQDRLTNAGENEVVSRNGMFVGYHVWGMAPIKEFKTKGKGKWDEEKTIPSRYWATYIGELDSSPVCVRLRSNPRHDGRVPYLFLHSHRDDKGAFHDGFPQLIQSLYWQATTNINQAFDNVTLMMQAPWIVDGELYGRMKRWRANQIYKTSRGTTFKQADVRDATQSTIAMNERVERDIERTTGADKPILGEALGSRASATEAKQTLDQASLPLDDKAGYTADQLFTWLYELDAADWRQNGDPNTVVLITRSHDMRDLVAVSPAELWGPIRTKVVAISRFRNNVQRRQEVNIFIQNAYPHAKEYMDDEGNSEFWRDTFKLFGFDKGPMYFPDDVGYESEARAREALYSIVKAGQDIEPDPRVNHRVWLRIFKNFIHEYEVTEGRDDDVLQRLRAHVAAHENFASQQEQQRNSQLAAAAAGGGQGLPGEVGANPMEAEEGALNG